MHPSALLVWIWRRVMARVTVRQERRFARHPVDGVQRVLDVAYVDDGDPEHRLDVLRPAGRVEPAPVYVYFHGGGWTSGDKSSTDRYCASQAAAGFVVVNANYRLASGRDEYHMRCMVDDANRVLGWVRDEIARFGGDPERIVVGGDSAGGQIAALAVAAASRPDLAAHFALDPALPAGAVRGVVQHCSFSDVGPAAKPWSPALGFVRLLLPRGGRGLKGAAFAEAARYLSPVEWIAAGFPATFVSTSARDFLRASSAALVERLRRHDVPVDSVVLGRRHRRAGHTWQQDASLPESQLVYRRLQGFLRRVTAPPVAV
ncbi:alpha/beta hydrolase [Amnibacterium kyonggiense]|uniref:Acetyl esterase/lipase n=1 Tax=Amnibacterium kyonggiense TaxID=595671 RepID=A0A4R7FKJ6_9MICO|nr:alpha/beta hydrolase [Amnibacterium kyonggiense]TDS76868.1 acetyl esterase/lipase [Amnibacterium kyonggiense]